MSALTDKVNELSQTIADKEQAQQTMLAKHAQVEQVYAELRDLLDGKTPVSQPQSDGSNEAPAIEEAPVQ